MSFPRASVTFHRADSKLNRSFQGDWGPRKHVEGTLHDAGIGCIRTRLGGKAVELLTRGRSKNGWPSSSRGTRGQSLAERREPKNTTKLHAVYKPGPVPQ